MVSTMARAQSEELACVIASGLYVAHSMTPKSLYSFKIFAYSSHLAVLTESNRIQTRGQCIPTVYWGSYEMSRLLRGHTGESQTQTQRK